MNETAKKLIEQAKEKGFKIGVEFYSAYSFQLCKPKKGIFEYEKDKFYEILYLDDNAIYCNGRWSEIISQQPQCEILTALKLMADYYIHEKPLTDLELEDLNNLAINTIKKYD